MKKLLVVLVLFGVSSAYAGDIKKIEADFSSCGEKAESTRDMNDCSDAALKAADAELNSVYQSIKSPLAKAGDEDSKEILRRLVASQKAWLVFRDANCNLAGTDNLGGSGEGVVINNCLATSTINRVKELQTYAEPK